MARVLTGLGFEMVGAGGEWSELEVELIVTDYLRSQDHRLRRDHAVFVSATEARFARKETERFRLYRLFNFRIDPRFFELPGALEQHCHLDLSTYRASMR